MIFKDRHEAGRQLAERLIGFREAKDTLVLALPRGGVVVAYEVARVLNLPLDIVVARKIGASDNPELAIGAIAPDGEGIFDPVLLASLNVSPQYLRRKTEEERLEIERRTRLYRAGREAFELKGQTVILVDDGIATGYTMRASVDYLKRMKVAEITVAVPVAARDTYRTLLEMVDRVIALYIPDDFGAVGRFYKHFEQTTDEEVIAFLQTQRVP